MSYLRSFTLKSQAFDQTFPASANSTPLRFFQIGTRTSAEKFANVRPPTGDPPSLSGDTSYRPQQRRLVAPPRKYSLENATVRFSGVVTPMLLIGPPRARTASTSRLASVR